MIAASVVSTKELPTALRSLYRTPESRSVVRHSRDCLYFRRGQLSAKVTRSVTLSLLVRIYHSLMWMNEGPWTLENQPVLREEVGGGEGV